MTAQEYLFKTSAARFNKAVKGLSNKEKNKVCFILGNRNRAAANGRSADMKRFEKKIINKINKHGASVKLISSKAFTPVPQNCDLYLAHSRGMSRLRRFGPDDKPKIYIDNYQKPKLKNNKGNKMAAKASHYYYTKHLDNVLSKELKNINKGQQ